MARPRLPLPKQPSKDSHSGSGTKRKENDNRERDDDNLSRKKGSGSVGTSISTPQSILQSPMGGAAIQAGQLANNPLLFNSLQDAGNCYRELKKLQDDIVKSMESAVKQTISDKLFKKVSLKNMYTFNGYHSGLLTCSIARLNL